jgi:sugar/nucleoside kinase (ribokinase family)
MTATWDVLGFGISAVDELLEVDAYPPPDVKMPLKSHQALPGGTCVNCLAAIARLGLRAHFAGHLGDNPLSQLVRDGMDDAGVTYQSAHVDPAVGPTVAYIIVDASNGTRTILMDRSRIRYVQPGDLPDELIGAARAVYLDAHHLPPALHAAKAARRLGVQVLADFEENEPEAVREILPYVDHLIVPEAYGRVLTETATAEEAVMALASEPRVCTAVTCGEGGSYFVTGEAAREVRHQPAFEVPVVDTTGCGDAFHGAYLAAVLRDMNIAEAMQYASAAAALSACALGAQAALPDDTAVRELIGRYAGGHAGRMVSQR